MFWFIISILCILVSCSLLGSIIGPKLRYLSSLKVEELHSEKEAKIKNTIIKNRIKRHVRDGGKYLFLILEPCGQFLKKCGLWFGHIHQYLLEVREKQRRSTRIGGATVSTVPLSLDEKIKQVLQEARGFLFEERYAEAEQKCIEVIALDTKRCEAYKSLSEIYRNQKDWEHAREVLEYLVKLESEKIKKNDSNDANDILASYAQTRFILSEVYQKCDQYDLALQSLKNACELEPVNPKFLDALVDLYIVLKVRLKAEKALENLEKANPENNKLDELREKIKELAY